MNPLSNRVGEGPRLRGDSGWAPVSAEHAVKPLTPAQRVLRARLAAYASHAGHDPRERTAHLQGTSPQHLGYWIQRVRGEHPDWDEAEIARRADLRHRQRMTKLAFASSKAAAARRAAKQNRKAAS